MKKDDWQKVKQILDDAIAMPAIARRVYLDRAVGSNSELRREVDGLLAAYESGFLEDTAMSAAAQALAGCGLTTGHVVGRYKIGESIGTGGMGEVYRAEDTELDRSVAFKVLHSDIAGDEERVRRFIQEARAASALNHPNILTIHEIGTFEGSRFIVSEYINGATLRERMSEGLKTAESIDITCQIAAALQAAHTAGIVHRDIKPENVMIRKDGLVKVLDFGLAKLTEADDRPIDASAPLSRIHTSPGLVMGTVAYMSPEQAKGQPVDARTDLWSLGVVLHEMLTGRSPFEGESVTELLSSIIAKETAPADLDSLPPDLRPICKKALAKDKDSRYRSAHDLLIDLEGEKKRMEYAIDSNKYVTVSTTDEKRTQVIGPRRTLSAEYIVTSVQRHKYLTFSVVLATMFAALGLTVYKYRAAVPGTSNGGAPTGVINAGTTEKDLKFTRLVGPQRMFDIAISPDGKFIAYTTGITGWTKSIHIKEMATQRDSELVPAPSLADGTYDYSMLSFAPDDSRLLYTFWTQSASVVFCVPLSGGPSTKIAENTSSASISPDGRRIAFDRDILDVHRQWQAEDLVVADVNGGNEKVLVHVTDENRFIITGVPAWSPDGTAIACWFNVVENGARYGNLFAVSTDDGSRQSFSDAKWNTKTAAIWMPDGSLIVAGSTVESGTDVQQLWRVTRSQAKRITNDAAGYYQLSATRDGRSLVTIQQIRRRDLWVMNGTDSTTARQVTFSGDLELHGGFEQLADGSVILNSAIANNTDLWSVALDGKSRKQLTADAGTNFEARTTPDGRIIVFTSDRAESYHVYRMDADGGNVKQLTDKPRTRCIAISPDGRWIYYRATDDASRQIFKMPIDGGPSTLVANVSPKGAWYDLAADGRIAESFFDAQSGQKEIRIYTSGGSLIRNIPLPPTTGQEQPIRWTRDGKSIAFNDRLNGGANIWVIAVSGNGKPKPLTHFSNSTTGDFNWSRDGKQMFVTRNSLTSDGLLITNVEQ